MTRAAFAALGTYTPERVVTNEELTRCMETSDEWITQRTGIKERHWVAPGMGNSDMALEATRRALDAAGWKATDIEAIVYATLSTDHMFPGDGCFLNAKLGLPGVPALDVRNQCSGFLYGLSVADAWIRTGMFRRVLLVGSEVHSTGLDVSTRGRDVAVIFGDGAGAALLEATEDPDARRPLLPPARRRPVREGAVDGRAGQHLPPAPQQGDGRGTTAIYPRMEGQKVFKHAIVKMPEVMREALPKERAAPRTSRSSSHTRPTSASRRWSRRRWSCATTRCSTTSRGTGTPRQHRSRSAWRRRSKVRGVKRGDLVGLCAFGAGFTWASALIRW